MENKNELTEKLKVIENEINDCRIDLKALHAKIENAYLYEEELRQRMVFAAKQTTELRNQFFIKNSEILTAHHKIKDIVDVFTGNFYRG